MYARCLQQVVAAAMFRLFFPCPFQMVIVGYSENGTLGYRRKRTSHIFYISSLGSNPLYSHTAVCLAASVGMSKSAT